MMTGNLWLDAILTGGISAIAGLATKKALTPVEPKLVREFHRTGGQTWDEVIDSLKYYAEDGWIPVGVPVRTEEPWGRDLCPRCFYETTDNAKLAHNPEIRNRCPACNKRTLIHWRETWVWFIADLYRDTQEEP